MRPLGGQQKKALRAFLLGGLLPVIAFTVIEERFGTIAGLAAGMVFGAGEISWEWATQRRVSAMTWAGNGMLFILGGISLLTREGIWFKLQPALIEALMALGLGGSCVLGRPLLLSMARSQGAIPNPVPSLGSSSENPMASVYRIMERGLSGMTWRLGAFFAIHAALAAWAAFQWSTSAWALLKGVGFTGSFLVYLVVESLLLRYRIALWKKGGWLQHPESQPPGGPRSRLSVGAPGKMAKP